MTSILGIGECMVELSSAGAGLWRQAFSGDVFNALWYARAASKDDVSISFHTGLGTDPLSDQMLEFGESVGIHWDHIPRLPDRRPGLYSIHLNGAERSFTYWRDTSAATMMMRHPELLWPKVDAADVVYFSGITLAILPTDDCQQFLTELKRRKSGTTVIVFDPNIRPHLWADKDNMRTVITQAASLSDIVLPSFDDEALAFGDQNPTQTAQRYQSLGASHVVVKDGPGDVVVLKDHVLQHFSVPAILDVVDTTAAGDSFNGSYLAGHIQGLSTADAIAMAQKCAGRVIQRKGALVAFSDLGL